MFFPPLTFWKNYRGFCFHLFSFTWYQSLSFCLAVSLSGVHLLLFLCFLFKHSLLINLEHTKTWWSVMFSSMKITVLLYGLWLAIAFNFLPLSSASILFFLHQLFLSRLSLFIAIFVSPHANPAWTILSAMTARSLSNLKSLRGAAIGSAWSIKIWNKLE